jgi:hypothetical protein
MSPSALLATLVRPAPRSGTKPALRALLSLCVLQVFTPLVIGAGIYTCWRSKHLLVFSWYSELGISVNGLRHWSEPLANTIPTLILNSLPDAMWVYSFTSCLCLVWGNKNRGIIKSFWITLPCALAVVAEFGQFLRLVPGTFDLNDLIAYVISGLVAYASTTQFLKSMVLQRE